MGRTVGIVFGLPALYFLRKGWISKPMKPRLAIYFSLLLFQVSKQNNCYLWRSFIIVLKKFYENVSDQRVLSTVYYICISICIVIWEPAIVFYGAFSSNLHQCPTYSLCTA